MQHNLSTTIRFSILTAIASLFFVAVPSAYAASLFINPQESTHLVGEIASFDVYVDTEGTVINAVSGSVSYAATTLEPISITSDDAIIDLWVQKPAVISSGKISFEGLVHNPGFQGTGRVATINFRVLKEGTGSLSFTEGLVLANDGQGTNVLGSFADALFVGKKGSLDAGTELPDSKDALAVEDLVERIRPPVITQYSRSVAALDELFMQGITYPNAEVKVWLQREKDEATERSIASDGAGNFVYVHGRDSEGRETLPSRVAAAAFMPFVKQHYYFWTSVVRDGVESDVTQLFDVTVGGIGGIDASPFAIFIGALVILVILLILGLLVYIIMRGRKIFGSTPPPSLTRLE